MALNREGRLLGGRFAGWTLARLPDGAVLTTRGERFRVVFGPFERAEVPDAAFAIARNRDAMSGERVLQRWLTGT